MVAAGCPKGGLKKSGCEGDGGWGGIKPEESAKCHLGGGSRGATREDQ